MAPRRAGWLCNGTNLRDGRWPVHGRSQACEPKALIFGIGQVRPPRTSDACDRLVARFCTAHAIECCADDATRKTSALTARVQTNDIWMLQCVFVPRYADRGAGVTFKADQIALLCK